MGVLKVALEDELEKGLRLAIGSRLGMRRGALTKAVSEAIVKWIRDGKPECYFAKGYFFEVPVSKISEFVKMIIGIIEPRTVTLHFINSLRTFSYEEFMKIIENNHKVLEKPDLLIEFGEAKLYHAHNGCFMLKAKLGQEQISAIAESIVKLSLMNNNERKFSNINSFREVFVWGDGYVEVKQ